MEIVLGFLIAVAIGITGVGAGIITAPVLILFFHVPPANAVGTALAFGVAVKVLVVPFQLARKQVNFRVLRYMLAGGVPGVVIGSLFLKHLVTVGSQNLLNALLGSILVTTAAWQIANSFKPLKANAEALDRSPMLAWLMLPVGAEVGFSSAGAGALGSAALLSLTRSLAVEAGPKGVRTNMVSPGTVATANPSWTR